MSLVIRERDRDRDRDRDWDEGSHTHRSTFSRGSPPRGSGGTFRTVRRYRVNRPAEEEDSYDHSSERERRFSRTGGTVTAASISHHNSDRDLHDLRDRPFETERRIVIDRSVERDRPRPIERELQIEREPPYEREVRTIEIDREREVARPLPYELERYTRSAEYFAKPEPAPQPIIIRQQAPQQIIIQEAPAEPIVIRREVEPSYEIVRREEVEVKDELPRRPRKREEHYEEYEYRRESRSEDRRDDRHARRGRDPDEEYYSDHAEYRRRSVSPRESASQYGREDRYSDDDLVIVREEEYSDDEHDHHHRRHLAEGAAAGLGAAALLNRHQKKQRGGEAVDHRGRKLVGSAAVGALAAEGISRVRSRSRHSRRTKSRHRSRSESHHRAKDLAKLGLGAAAVAAAVKIASNKYQENKASDGADGARRSRSRRRFSMSGGKHDSSSSDGEGGVKHDNKHRNSRIGQAALGGAAAVGAIEAVRNKVQERRTGRSRSRSRLRQGIPIAAAALGSAGIAGIYETQKKKKEEAGMERDSRRRSRSRHSRSRSRSMGAYSDPGRTRGDPNAAGLIEYGDQPISANGNTADFYGRSHSRGRYDSAADLPLAAGAIAGTAAGASRGHGRDRSHSRDRGYDSYDSYSENDRHKRHGKNRRHRSGSRSRSRGVKGLAETGLAAGAAGLAASHFSKKRDRKNAELNRQDDHRHEYSPGGYDEQYSPAPTGASAEYYPHGSPQGNVYPPPPVPAPAPAVGYGVPPYNPQDYAGPGQAQPTLPAGPAVDPYGYNPAAPLNNSYAPQDGGPRGEERTADNIV